MCRKRHQLIGAGQVEQQQAWERKALNAPGSRQEGESVAVPGIRFGGSESSQMNRIVLNVSSRVTHHKIMMNFIVIDDDGRR